MTDLFADLYSLFESEESEGRDPLLPAELSAHYGDPAEAAVFEKDVAAMALLEAVATGSETAPRDLVDAEIRRWKGDGVVLPFAARTRPATVPSERFMLLAAASEAGSKAVLCRSQSGIWTLEIFVAPDDASKGYLLLSVHPEHRATYEGLTAHVFVRLQDEERVLTEAVVRKGEIYTAVSLEGLDLHMRDAVNVTFSEP